MITISDEEYRFLDDLDVAWDDNERRLVYSDWLAESGDLRAEFLQLEVRFDEIYRTENAKHVVDKLVSLVKKINDSSWTRRVTKNRASQIVLSLRLQTRMMRSRRSW